jgi:hypothetical protein
MNITNERLLLLLGLESLVSVHIKDVEYVDCAAVLFSGKRT